MNARMSTSMQLTGWQRKLCVWLSALMLFASMAPGFSQMLHAGLFSFSSSEHCVDTEGEHATHEHHSGHGSESSKHVNGIHCPFCLLFQHLPIIAAGHDAAIGPVADRFINSIEFSVSSPLIDRARRWLQRQKHSPPFP
jgi:hypothetical protein